MSWTAVILIVSWLCFISVSEATLGASCNQAADCTTTFEICTDVSCKCSSGYFNVSNECKSSSITVNLSIKTQNAVYGSEVIHTATITSEVPVTTLKWQKGTKELDISSSKYTQRGDGPGTVTLTIKHVDFTDSGNYKVEVSNIAGRTTTSNQVSLTVTGGRPIVTIQGTISETGTTLAIHCTVSVTQGSPELTAVYWLYNGQNLDILDSAKYSGGTMNSPSLTIKNIAFTDAGVYHCGAINLVGSTTSSQSVTLAPPSDVTISEQPRAPVNYASSITFTGSYTSNLLSVTIKWQKLNGSDFIEIDILGDDKYSGSSVTGSSPKLLINSVQFIDETVYRLVVGNGVGWTLSNFISLNVVGDVISVTLKANATSIVYGSSVVLTATITSAIHVDTVVWQKEKMNIDMTDEKYTQSDVVYGEVTLTITNFIFNDDGSYRVKVNNSAGITSTWSVPVTLTLNGETPTVVVPGTITERDTSVIIHCIASVSQGSPALTVVYWLLNGYNMDISNSVKYSGGTVSNPSLSIHNIASTDAGEYRCGATNPVGSRTSLLSVTLAAPSDVTILQQPVGPVYYDSSVIFTGSFTLSLPGARNIRWQKLKGNNLVDIDITGEKYTGSSVTGPSPKLVINSVQFIDKTTYGLVVSNGVGSNTSNNISLNIIGGYLTVTIGSNVTGRFGGSITIGCTVTGPEVNKIQWIKYINNVQVNISIDGVKYTGGSLFTKALTIHNLTNDDAGQYQCAAYNAGGVYISANRATVQVIYGQFYENCTSFNPCDLSKFLTCTHSKCLCVNTYYHKDQVCYPKIGLVPTTIFLNSTTSKFSVFWNNPTTHYQLVSGYEVKWGVASFSTNSSGTLSRTVNQYTVSNNLIPGQLYRVNVISYMTLTGPADSTFITSTDRTVRTVPSAPGPIEKSESNFAHNNLQIRWTAPVNTLVTRYEVTIDGTTYNTINSDALYQFTGKVFIPGKSYVISIVTITGTTDVKRSSEHTEWMKITPTKPDPPTNLQCPQNPSDVSLKISWTAPSEPNGNIVMYQINVSPRHLGQIYTSSNETHTNVEGLLPEQMYTFTVRSINDAVDNTSEPSQSLMCKTNVGVPPQPGQIIASVIQSSSLTLAWTLADPSPGNTTYTIYTHEGTDDIGTHFFMKKSTKVYGFYTTVLLVTGLEEYWPYKFKVNAATTKGNTTSNFSSVFKTKQAHPGRVLNLTIQKKGNDYRSAYVSWSPPALKDHNGVLKSYLFSNNHTGTMKEEEIPVLLSQSTVEVKFPVIPEAVYFLKVILQNNESMTSQISWQIYEAPAGPPPVTDIEPLTTKPGEHKPTTNTITLDINTTYFKNNDNGKQVFFGVAVCAESKCRETGQTTIRSFWEYLPNWHKAKKEGFPLYRVTNDTFMDEVRQGDSRQKRSTLSVSTLNFIIGEDLACSYLNDEVYCNGPLQSGTSYNVIIFACTNGGCTYLQTDNPFLTIQQPIESTNYSLIIGSVVTVTLVVALVVIGTILWRRNRRQHKERKDQANTYADLDLDELTKVDQPYSLLEHGSRTVQSKSVPLNSFFDYVVNLLRNNRQKLTKEYHDLLQYTDRGVSTVASSKDNVSKNRGSIIPYDYNRVKLCLPGTSDYIDASFLLDKFYILTSYPIARTFGNFWKMVWEQTVSTIVVITGQSDARESWYFPDNEGTVRTIERIDVELLAKLRSSESFTMRKIKMSKGKHSKVVNHFHVISLEMTDLPDQILALINTITQNTVKNTGPQVVHGGCSGVDNSGVYIAVDHAVKSVVSGGNEIDVYGTARTVMKERMFSISSLEQYSAIYTCLQKYLQNSPACKNDATGAYEYLP